MMHTIEVTAETQTKLVAALNVHALDPRICVTVRRHAESPAFISGIIDAWPADEDGLFRPALSFDHLTVLWRAYALAEIAAGRGWRKFGEDYASELGLTGGDFVPAFDYAAKRLKGAGVRPRHPATPRSRRSSRTQRGARGRICTRPAPLPTLLCRAGARGIRRQRSC